MRKSSDRETSASGIAEEARAFIEQMIEFGERSRPLRRLLEPAGIRVQSPGGEAAVVVTGGGVLIGVDFGAGHEDMDQRELAEMLLDAYDSALAEVERRRIESPEKAA
ncbi:hypothetical protein K3N28_15850 [Glycomyces sp. TRM65418]|uniref:hypothetical protein n=1 Tax=Glycomyces sp. TRM65418 TaxID=2867006 RepID=UPI001CE53E66|nr:hypothetical protein [Glycomyces sp. TRM65418]MCC3764536.1 hypothetical protein [Glycomyces sp. TRM65418]QZD54203.1 hypothetical protein K3N28_15770 [Glycomyces sp. TRM65418]